ncbi:hypothetical protein FRZ67_22715 [Panacibacter ginsenosidivorans]|uniref:CCDC81-like prokaryotic HU domain-containing protein n=1 Tax=Panacibacter ginsenosidivorans TaxID=1813871 RepID=A0A5B8VFW6_9BACT|nr:hypothetical protein [Panacibacter ginsenosidivorans]QEC69971.1 hypothetical protein FRZ67_22715 [Panacibacter ginsenosidivorans]
MTQYLAKYFALHRKLVLPGIGFFNTSTQPAQLEFVEKTLHAPVHTINFWQDENVADNNFISFLIKETGLNHYETINKFSQFITGLKEKLQSGVALKIPGLGILTNNENGYSFNPENLQQYFPGITAERVIRQNAQHSVRVGEDEKTSVEMHEMLNKEVVKDRWWIGAIVLAVVGVAAILYYYLSR